MTAYGNSGKYLGITPKAFTKELKKLQYHQLISRTMMDGYPVKVSFKLKEYSGTLTLSFMRSRIEDSPLKYIPRYVPLNTV